jgi:hypothetical protein
LKRPIKTKGPRKPSTRSQTVWIVAIVAVLSTTALRPEFDRWLAVAPPSAEIEYLAIATTMTPDAQQLFYRQTPTIEPKSTFFKVCKNVAKTSDTQVMFGCYISNGRSGKIAIQSIADTRFQGVMEVTAAHEMLHAAYNRLSPSERSKLTPRLKQAALRVKNERLSMVLKEYERMNSALFVNELHSHLGTELDDLGDPKLEEYYQRYFRDRRQVVALAEQSQESVKQLDEKAQELKSEIETLEASLMQAKQRLKDNDLYLESKQQELDMLRSNLIGFKEEAEELYRQGQGSPALIAQFERLQFNYNENVQTFNDRLHQHQARVADFNEQVEVYKQKVSAYNAIAHEERSLFSDLQNTPLTPIESVDQAPKLAN